MYSLSYILLLAFIVCLADRGKCKPSALVGVSAETLAAVPPADSRRYAEKRPAIHHTQSPGGPHHNRGFHAYHHGSPGTTRTTSASLSRQRRGPPSYFSTAYKMWRVPLAAVMVLIVFTALRERCLSRADSAPASTQSGAPSRRLARGRRDIELVCMGLSRPADAEEAELLLPGARTVAAVDDFWMNMPETEGSLLQGYVDGGDSSLRAGRNIGVKLVRGRAHPASDGPVSMKEDILQAVVFLSSLAAICILWLLAKSTYILPAKSGTPAGSNLTSNITDGNSTGPSSPPGITPSMILQFPPVHAAVNELRHMRTCHARERRSGFR